MTTKALIIEARFYDEINDMLVQGAQTVLEGAGVEYDVLTVPGALEISAALNFTKDKYDAFVTLGCVIRGETTHYEICCNESARGIYDLVLQHNLALGNGIQTVENKMQAITRADPAQKNKGAGAAEAALRMLEIKKKYAA